MNAKPRKKQVAKGILIYFFFYQLRKRRLIPKSHGNWHFLTIKIKYAQTAKTQITFFKNNKILVSIKQSQKNKLKCSLANGNVDKTDHFMNSKSTEMCLMQNSNSENLSQQHVYSKAHHKKSKHSQNILHFMSTWVKFHSFQNLLSFDKHLVIQNSFDLQKNFFWCFLLVLVENWSA